MSVNLIYLQPKNKLKELARKTELFNIIVEKIEGIKDFNSLKFDNELLVFVCNCIENGLHNKKKKYKLDKKLLCLEIYQKVFTLTEKEKEQISNSIEFLCQNKMIDIIPVFKKYGTIFIHYIKSKL